MKVYIITSIMLLMAVISCHDQAADKKQFTDAKIADSTQIFLSLFNDLTEKNIHVYSPCDKSNGNKFSGKLMKKTFYHYFNFNKDFDEIMKNISDDTINHIFSCFKFPLSDDKTGLLVRWPSQYTESLIYLFVWDNQGKRIVDAEALSDGFGDEGWYFVQDAWLKDLNNDGKIDIIIRKKDYSVDLDSLSNVSNSDSLFCFINKGTHFEKTKVKVDTSKFQLFDWSE